MGHIHTDCCPSKRNGHTDTWIVTYLTDIGTQTHGLLFTLDKWAHRHTDRYLSSRNWDTKTRIVYYLTDIGTHTHRLLPTLEKWPHKTHGLLPILWKLGHGQVDFYLS